MAGVSNDTAQLIEYELDSLKHPHEALSQWEVSFIESITDQWNRKRYLSDKQLEKLNRIYEDRA